MKDEVSRTFVCKCKKMEGWVTEGKVTKPCPVCGRVYKGIPARTTIKLKEVNKWQRLKKTWFPFLKKKENSTRG